MEKSNLIVNYLPFSIDEHGLSHIFRRFGKILSVKVVRDRITRNSMGFGFVNFETNEEAEKAILGMNGRQLDGGKFLKVSVARPAWKANIHSNLYVAGLPPSFSEEDVKDLFVDYRGHVEQVRFLKGPLGETKGVGVVRFDSEEAAYHVMKSFDGVTVPGCVQPLYIRPWKPEYRAERLGLMPMADPLAPQPAPPPFAWSEFRNEPFRCPPPPLHRRPSSSAFLAASESYRSMTGSRGGPPFFPPFHGYPLFPPEEWGEASALTTPAGKGQGDAGGSTFPSMNAFPVGKPKDHGSFDLSPSVSKIPGPLLREGPSPPPLPEQSLEPKRASSSPACVFLRNLPPEVDEMTLKTLCMPFGSVDGLTFFPKRRSVLVHFRRKEEAETAKEALEGLTLGGSTLELGDLHQKDL